MTYRWIFKPQKWYLNLHVLDSVSSDTMGLRNGRSLEYHFFEIRNRQSRGYHGSVTYEYGILDIVCFREMNCGDKSTCMLIHKGYNSISLPLQYFLCAHIFPITQHHRGIFFNSNLLFLKGNPLEQAPHNVPRGVQDRFSASPCDASGDQQNHRSSKYHAKMVKVL